MYKYLIPFGWLIGCLFTFEVKATKELEIGAGAFAVQIPQYLGSDEEEHFVVPLPYVYYKDDNFKLDRNQFTGYLWQKDKLFLDLSASAGIAVDSSDNDARANMPDLDWVFELGPSLKYYLEGTPEQSAALYTEFFVRKALATDFQSLTDVGWRFGPAITYQKMIYHDALSHLELTARGAINFSDRKYSDYYYGIASEFENEQRKQFSTETGYAGSDLSLGFKYKNKSLWFGGFVRYYNLSNSEQEQSPLVKKHNSWAMGIGMAWIFYSKTQGN